MENSKNLCTMILRVLNFPENNQQNFRMVLIFLGNVNPANPVFFNRYYRGITRFGFTKWFWFFWMYVRLNFTKWFWVYLKNEQQFNNFMKYNKIVFKIVFCLGFGLKNDFVFFFRKMIKSTKWFSVFCRKCLLNQSKKLTTWFLKILKNWRLPYKGLNKK